MRPIDGQFALKRSLHGDEGLGLVASGWNTQRGSKERDRWLQPNLHETFRRLHALDAQPPAESKIKDAVEKSCLADAKGIPMGHRL